MDHTLDSMDLTGVHKTFRSAAAEYTFFSNVHRTLFRIDHVLRYYPSFFNLFYFYSSKWVLCTDLFSGSLVLSSAMSNFSIKLIQGSFYFNNFNFLEFLLRLSVYSLIFSFNSLTIFLILEHIYNSYLEIFGC